MIERAATRRLTIGVTGHRVLAEPDTVGAGIGAALDRIDHAFPGRTRTIVSSLAEGADRLVARLALARPGTRLVALLPLPPSDYVNDFTSDESRREFEDLLSRADEVVVQAPAGGPREQAYDAAGRRIVEQSDVVLAIWDGQAPHGHGGTGAVVAQARGRGVPIAWVHAGNRQRGTVVATSLGAEQGLVTFEQVPDVVPYRTRIGVIGDERPADRRALSAALHHVLAVSVPELFDERSRALLAAAHHTPIATSVVTTLSSETERILAREALEITGGRLEVVLPHGGGRALQGFTSPAEREDVAQLVALDRSPQVVGEGAGRADTTDPRIWRRRSIGHVLDRADVIVAIGEGDRARAASESARRARRPLLRIADAASSAVIVERGVGLHAGPVVRLDEYNAFAVREGDLDRYVDHVDRRLFGSRVGARVDPASRRMVRERLLPHYVRSSLLAKTSQRAHRRAGLSVWLLFPLAVAAVALGALSSGGVAVAAFVTELVVLLAIFSVVVMAHRARSHERWIECRFLVERIRSAALLAACGVEVSPIEPPPYAGARDARNDWALMAFNDIWNRLPPLPTLTTERCSVARSYARWHGIREQVRYHERAAAKAGRISRTLERGGAVAFALAMLGAVMHLTLTLTGHGDESVAGAALVFAAIVLPAVGAAFGGFRAHREYSRLSKRSQRMAQGLRRLKGRLGRVSSPDELTTVLREVERAMLSETEDWLALMEFVPVERPG
jgi:hypothetical protein